MILDIIFIMLFDGHHSNKSVYSMVGLPVVLTTFIYYPGAFKSTI
jgi:hypothetical protein